MSKEIVNLNYIPETSAAGDLTGGEIPLKWTVDSFAFQFVFTGQASGTALIQARIIPDKWEQLAGCDPISFEVDNADGTEYTNIVVLPETAKYCSAIRILWQSTNESATGTIRVASRLLPN